MKSWISPILPNDEYKEKKMLLYFAEGGVLLFLCFFILLISIPKIPRFDLETALLVLIGIFIFYVSSRYIFAGIEYTDVVTEGNYKKELKGIFRNIGGFLISFTLIYFMFIEIPTDYQRWVELMGLLITISLFWFIGSFLSLKRSYEKNKNLI